MRRQLKWFVFAIAVFILSTVFITPVSAATSCVFNFVGTRMVLTNNCTTDETIVIPQGYTLDGMGRMITAVDPPGGHFVGAVVRNEGTIAHVRNLRVTVSGLLNVCDGGADRLRGIMFEGASGTIINNKVLGVRQVASGCQEGNSIEVRNEPFDGTHPNTHYVTIWANTISDYMKTGIVANGDVNANIQFNILTSSANQANLAANGIQVGFGALANVRFNIVGGNTWQVNDTAAATGILVYDAEDGVVVRNNKIYNNADVGIYFIAEYGTISQNIVIESGTDGFYDVGIGNYGIGNVVEHNIVQGYDIPYEEDF
ncbi:MAG: hypothetical protein JNJ61_08030 [Anaerolineae bacterium]|nr:hypothetical protein [Anaerolineae bacterium]